MNKIDMLVVVLLAVVATGVTLAWRYYQGQRRVRRAQGVVVDHVESSEASIGTFYYAVVEFIDAGGQRIRFTDRFGHGGQPLFPVGAPVNVDYALLDPAQARIHGVAMSRSVGLGALVLGLVLVVAGVWPR